MEAEEEAEIWKQEFRDTGSSTITVHLDHEYETITMKHEYKLLHTREPVLKIQDLEGRIAFRHFGKMCCRGLAEVN